MGNRISILELNHEAAKQFFLKHESYCNIDLPKYFSFSKLLQELSDFLETRKPSELINSKTMNSLENLNHFIYANKDGKLSWRPFQLIHPFSYVILIKEITQQDNWNKIKDRFKVFQSNKQIRCLSIPVESTNQQTDKAQQISQWWENVEQESILLSLEYNYIFDTDIADCYGSIYTHSIAWALEDKGTAKNKPRDQSLLGNKIDKQLQELQNKQTNGIPQGSVVMDFIAEILLGYIDKLLSEKLTADDITEYQILRYRDDYRIFVQDNITGEKILKTLSEIMIPFGLKINSSKTSESSDIITKSIKADKLSWLKISQPSPSLQKQLLLIREHSIKHPNSGSLNTALNKFDKKVAKSKRIMHPNQLIAILTDIAYKNPKTISICCSVISKLIDRSDKPEDISRKVFDKLNNMPNSGFAQIWLQRMLKKDVDNYTFKEKLCLIVTDPKEEIWDNSWITSSKVKKIFKTNKVYDKEIFDSLDSIISNDEIDLFAY
ncbi:RNA-directed DNA polymerase [Conservatibacter flavescens]|uniref:Cobalt transporter n=1 Tax=Conservatibacter flavescens TaxID=28161 RepID=A0A2M8S5D1_9PAST|nr:RNA-directed DNA polymerase [Conservatibacter flavescens]PJG86341.1 cobalt transporter [Conservatibacter flavescens]